MQESAVTRFLRLFALAVVWGAVSLNGAAFIAVLTKSPRASKPAISSEPQPAPIRLASRVVAGAEAQGRRAKSEAAHARVQFPEPSAAHGSAPGFAQPSLETEEAVDAVAEVLPLPRSVPEKALATFISPLPPLPLRSPNKANSATAARSETPPLPVRAPEDAGTSIAKSLLQQTGRASWYALDALTASGEKLDHAALTAAHNDLPFGTKVRIDNIANGLSVVVRINDRGPFVGGRIIDLSRAAAEAIDMIAEGIVDVRVSVVHDTVASASGR